MILFLEMSVLHLGQSEKELILSKLDSDLKATYQKFKPQELLPSEAKTKGIISSNVIISGIPKLIDSKSDFMGFIMFPIVSGNVTTFIMIPLIDQYDVYEVRDDESDKAFLIAHMKDSVKFPEKRITIGGVLKELKATKHEEESSGKFLEAVYHC